MPISEATIQSIAASVSETPVLEQREVMTPAPEDIPGMIDFTIWGEDEVLAEFRIPRSLWTQFKAFGDTTLAAFDAAAAGAVL